MEYWAWLDAIKAAIESANLEEIESVLMLREDGWPSVPLREGTALHHAVLLDSGRRDAVCLRLVELGADISAESRQWGTPLKLAHERGAPELAEAMVRRARETGPLWRREAAREGVALIRFYYHKAAGLQFRPNDVKRPFLCGGDYDGARPGRIQEAVEEMEWGQGRGAFSKPWFVPLLKRMEADEEVSLKEFLRAADPRDISTFRV